MAKKAQPIYGIDDEIEQVEFAQHQINQTPLPDGSDSIKLDNVVNVSEQSLRKILKRTNQATRVIVRSLLNRSLPLALSYDNATSFVEAAMRDGLNIEIEIDDDISKAIDQLNKLSSIYLYSRMVELPICARKQFLREMTTHCVTAAVEAMKVSSNTRKYSQRLRETVAHVSGKAPETTDDASNSIGVKRSRRTT
jgi:hypothetical protein